MNRLLQGGPERLTPRARSYLLGVAAQHAFIAWFAFTHPEFFASKGFDGIKAALSPLSPEDALATWGGALAVVAGLCVAAAIQGSDGIARAALLASVVIEGAWFGGYVSAWKAGSLFTPVGLACWAGMLYRDLTMLRNPLRNPFEPLVRRLLREPERAAHDVPA